MYFVFAVVCSHAGVVLMLARVGLILWARGS